MRRLGFVPVFLLMIGCNESGSIHEDDSACRDSVLNKIAAGDLSVQPSAPFYDFSAFLPDTAYVLYDSVIGDLNRDQFPDAILVYVHASELRGATYSERPRPFFILLGDSTGQFVQFLRNDNVVYHEVDGQMFGEPYAGIVIDSGMFRVNHYGGSRFRWTADYIFEYDRDKQSWFYTRSYATAGDMLGEMNELDSTGQFIPSALDTLIIKKPIDIRKFDNRTADVADAMD